MSLKVNTPEGKELLKQLIAKPEETMARIMADLNSGKEVKGASLVKDSKTKEKELTASAKVTVGVVSVGAKFNIGNKLAVEVSAVTDKKVDIQLTKTNTIGGEVSAEAKLGSPHEKVPVNLGSVGASANAKKESTDSVKISIDRTNPAGEALYIEMKKNPEATMAKIVAKLKAGQQVPGVNLLEQSQGDTVTKGYKINFFDKLSVSGGSDLSHKTTTKKDEKGNTVVVNDNAASRSAGAAFEGSSITLPFTNKHIELLPKAAYERKSAFTAQDENGKLKTASLQVTVNTTELESAARDLATATNTGWNFNAVEASKGVKYNANWTVKYNLSEEQMNAIISHVDSGKSLMLYHHSSTEVEPIKALEKALKAAGGDKPAQYRLLSEFIEKTQHYGIQTILETMKRNGIPSKEMDLSMSVKNANESERVNLPIGSEEKNKLRGKMEQYVQSAKDGSMSKDEIRSAIAKDIDTMKKWGTKMADTKQYPELPIPIRERVTRESGESVAALEQLRKELGL